MLEWHGNIYKKNIILKCYSITFTTITYLKNSGFNMWSVLNVSVTYLCMYVGNGSSESKSYTRHFSGSGWYKNITW